MTRTTDIITATALTAAAITAVITATPSTTPIRKLEAACIRQQTFGIDRHTYVCVIEDSRKTCERHHLGATCFQFNGTARIIYIASTGKTAS